MGRPKRAEEPRTERVYVSLRASTLAKLRRLGSASGLPVSGLISQLVEDAEPMFEAGTAALEKINAAKRSAALKPLRVMREVAGDV